MFMHMMSIIQGTQDPETRNKKLLVTVCFTHVVWSSSKRNGLWVWVSFTALIWVKGRRQDQNIMYSMSQPMYPSVHWVGLALTTVGCTVGAASSYQAHRGRLTTACSYSETCHAKSKIMKTSTAAAIGQTFVQGRGRRPVWVHVKLWRCSGPR